MHVTMAIVQDLHIEVGFQLDMWAAKYIRSSQGTTSTWQ